MSKICLTSGQKSPIILGQERDGPFVGPSKLDAGFAREIKRHRHALRTKAKRAKEEGRIGKFVNTVKRKKRSI